MGYICVEFVTRKFKNALKMVMNKFSPFSTEQQRIRPKVAVPKMQRPVESGLISRMYSLLHQTKF